MDSFTINEYTYVVSECPHCSEPFSGNGIANSVREYQNHLRSDHPEAWLRDR